MYRIILSRANGEGVEFDAPEYWSIVDFTHAVWERTGIPFYWKNSQVLLYRDEDIAQDDTNLTLDHLFHEKLVRIAVQSKCSDRYALEMAITHQKTSALKLILEAYHTDAIEASDYVLQGICIKQLELVASVGINVNISCKNTTMCAIVQQWIDGIVNAGGLFTSGCRRHSFSAGVVMLLVELSVIDDDDMYNVVLANKFGDRGRNLSLLQEIAHLLDTQNLTQILDNSTK